MVSLRVYFRPFVPSFEPPLLSYMCMYSTVAPKRSVGMVLLAIYSIRTTMDMVRLACVKGSEVRQNYMGMEYRQTRPQSTHPFREGVLCGRLQLWKLETLPSLGRTTAPWRFSV